MPPLASRRRGTVAAPGGRPRRVRVVLPELRGARVRRWQAREAEAGRERALRQPSRKGAAGLTVKGAKPLAMRQRRGTGLLAALFTSATLGGCGDSDLATSPTVTRTVTVPAATVTVASTTTTAKPDGCINLPITAAVRAELFDGKLDPGSVYYGRCGDTYWAAGSYTGPIGSEHYSFRRGRGHRTWEELGGVSDNSHLCFVPLELVRIWNFMDDPNCRRSGGDDSQMQGGETTTTATSGSCRVDLGKRVPVAPGLVVPNRGAFGVSLGMSRAEVMTASGRHWEKANMAPCSTAAEKRRSISTSTMTA